MNRKSMRRREFITLLGGAAAAWPVAARAQQAGGMRRIGWLIGADENDPGSQAQRAAFRESLAKLGWIEGRNLRIDLRSGAGIRDRIRAGAAELVSLAPDVIVTTTSSTTLAAQEQTRTIPIVFASGGDPVAAGLLRNIARPESNTTGFSLTEPSIGGKWLELLREGAPSASRIAVIFNPELVVGGYFASIEAAAPALSLQAIKMPVRDAVDVARAIDAFAATPNGGLLVLPPPPNAAIFDAILRLATEHRLPAIYGSRRLANAGALIAYGADDVDLNRRAASYVDRLLRGAKVSDLPVQFPTKYDLVINLKTAKAIGLTIPEVFLLRADEVIE
jgi:putative tryptophan/tyrosine transport system substrate-binding protein